ncbi:response regulator [Thermomonas aquatica]|uniref:Response regulator n=1 Tax=Thermomonas aquatica TaxID=2202149 RepID=A0A5B7ZRJ0_9GAMM|nr:response regulator [Thermomonas aquatica]QDA57349.1 response regulator [Thermomonas aquatica]HOM14592.1 response regulator [Rubrivivax sp.]
MNGKLAPDKEILLVEDNPDDAELTRIAFAETGGDYRLRVVSDGAEALSYLYACAPAELPALVLLDLNLPKLDGREVLQAIRAEPATRSLPVVVLTTSAEPFDVDKVYALGANSYIQKPVEFERFVEVVRQIGLYWLALNQPPTTP